MSLLRQRWASRELVGDSKHVVIVRVRQIIMFHDYVELDRLDTGEPIVVPTLVGGVNGPGCWKGQLIPVSNWQEVPNIVSVNWSRSFDMKTGGEQGSATCTVVMDNIAFIETQGVTGAYHTIERGHFSPTRGVHVDGAPRPDLWPGTGNEWQNVFNSGWQIEIWEGYGTGTDVQLKPTLDPATHSYAPDSGALARTYTGVILTCDSESHPDKITLTAQDFGVYLTDQYLMGRTKAWEIPSPVTFADYRRNIQGSNNIGWVLVHDASEVVMALLIWVGFREWVVDTFGWSLFQPLLFGSDKKHIDVINDMLQQGAYIFYIDAPTNDDRSIGVPHFEHISALEAPYNGMIEVRDTDMTEALDVKWDLSDLPYTFTVRGAITSSGGYTLWGTGIGGAVQRYTAIFFPPWSGFYKHLDPTWGNDIFESAGGIERTTTIDRPFIETFGQSAITQLTSNEECVFACVLAAIAYALGECTGQFQIPGIAPLPLNDQIGVVDEAQAVNSRMWIASVQSEHVTGGGEAPGYWRMTVGGSLIDTQDMQFLRDDYNYAWKLAQGSRQSLLTSP